jgi:hypothetical protein
MAGRAAARDRAYDLAGHCARFFNSGDVRFWELEPRGTLASTGVCLANPGREYVVYSATGEPFTVDLAAAGNTTLDARWYNPRTGRFQPAAAVAGGHRVRFTPPQTGAAVLHVHRRHP